MVNNDFVFALVQNCLLVEFVKRLSKCCLQAVVFALNPRMGLQNDSELDIESVKSLRQQRFVHALSLTTKSKF